MSILFEGATIGSMTLKNRFVRSATRELLASNDYRVTDKYVRLYEQLAKGGVGLIIPGSYYVNPIGCPSPGVILLHRSSIVPELKNVVETVQQHGAKIVAQLNHGGRQSDPKIIGTTPIGPSPVRDKLKRITPREMTVTEIEDTIDAFGQAARRVKEAGFDGIQIHAAHGYLVNQFLSGYTNRRNDDWGGPPANRMRFLIEIYNVMRSIVGGEYPILIKINAEDFVAGGLTLEESIAICRKLDEMGIDAIEVSGGIGEKGLVTIRGDVPMDLLMKNRNLIERTLIRLKERSLRKEAHFEEAYFLHSAAAIKKNVKCPIIAVGGMRRRATMEQALESGQADFISMCRPFIRQPNLVNQMQKDDADPISCSNCNRCSIEILIHHKPIRCYNSESIE